LLKWFRMGIFIIRHTCNAYPLHGARTKRCSDCLVWVVATMRESQGWAQ